MVTYTDIFTQFLGVPSPAYDPISFFMSFVIPLAVIWYAFYLLIGRIYQRNSIVQTILGLVLAFPTLRFGGSITMWLGLAGILGLRVRGITSKALGLAVVFVMFQYSSNLTLSNLPTVLALFGILYVLMKPWGFGMKLFGIAPIGLLWWALKDWQITSVTQFFPALFAFFAFWAWYQLSGWKRYVSILIIIVVYFFIATQLSLPSIPVQYG